MYRVTMGHGRTVLPTNFFGLALLLVTVVAKAASPATPPPSSPALSRDEAEHLLAVLKDPAQRAQFMATLDEYVRAAPSIASAGVKPPSPATPVSPGKVAPASSVIARAVKAVTQSAAAFAAHLGHAFRALLDWSALTAWIDALTAQPSARSEALQTGLCIALVAGLTLAVEILLHRIYARKTPPPSGAQAPQYSAGARVRRACRRLARTVVVLAIAGVIGNGAIFLALTDLASGTGSTIAFGILNAYLAVRLLMGVLTAVLSPSAPANRLVPMSDAGAAHAVRSAQILSTTLALGYVTSDLVAALGASAEVQESVQKLVALIVHFLLILMVIRSRGVVADWIRRRFGTKSAFKPIGEAFATAWPFIAVTAIVSWWLVWAMDIPDGYQRILRFVLTTTAVLILGQFLASFLIGLIDRRLSPLTPERPLGLSGRLIGYRRSIRVATQLTMSGLTLLVLMQTWGIDVLTWFDSGHVGNRLGILLLKLLLLAVIGIVCWEVADAAVEARVSRLMAASALARATRLRTLQPIVRIALIIVLSLVVILTALSEIGINVGPLLAGASIFGVALGFGSQKLVQDFITGIFLLVEDAMDVGDWVTLAGVSGTVEHLSIRTIRLRAGDGSVHLIPFSAVTSVNNTNRGVGNAAISVTVDAAEDTDRVAAILEQIAQEMRADPAYADSMQSDLQLWGVDKVEGSMATIVGQIVCTDAGRWPVQREFNRRLKKRFEQDDILLGIPRQSLHIDRMTHKPPTLPSGDSMRETSTRS